MSDDMNRDSSQPEQGGHTRRTVLKAAGAIGAAAGAAGILSACGASTTTGGSTPGSSTGAAAEGTPVRGGKLRVAHVGGGNSETLNPAHASSEIDASRCFNIFDPLTRIEPDMSQAPGLALEWTPNKDATQYEVKLRPDVTWHNGKPFTADDVIYTLQTMTNPAHLSHATVENIYVERVKKVNDTTLQIPLKKPNAELSALFTLQQTVIVPDEKTNWSKPNGTGPFKIESFHPGERSLGVANKEYWDKGKPYFDEWEDISIPDNTARLNALLAGQVDAMAQLEFTAAKAQEATGQINVLNGESPVWQVLTMRVDQAPFTDNRVREAFRLIADRQAIVDGALSGFGTPSNDLFGLNIQYWAEDLPVREQDIEKAKSLLKAAGQENLSVTLQTSSLIPGFIQTATLFAQQAKEAGVTVNVKKEPPENYFNPELAYTKYTFGQSNWQAVSMSTFYPLALTINAPYNETHWKKASFDKLVREAEAQPDENKAAEIWHEVQKIQYDEGGYLGTANVNNVDGLATYVKGAVPSGFWNLSAFAYRDWWFEK
jgi:peptide/nickel transport system substrate-binding protein